MDDEHQNRSRTTVSAIIHDLQARRPPAWHFGPVHWKFRRTGKTVLLCNRAHDAMLRKEIVRLSNGMVLAPQHCDEKMNRYARE